MKSTNHTFNNITNHTDSISGDPSPGTAPMSDVGKRAGTPPDLSDVRTTGREYVNPVDYRHPYESMGRFADLLALRYDANRTRHAYDRQVRLIPAKTLNHGLR